MRRWLIAGLLMGGMTLIVGCGPEVSKEELGEVIFEVPKIAPAESSSGQPADPHAGHQH